MNNKILGRKGEDAATNYLKSIGYEIVERNFSCKKGEIDIIAKENQNEYIFIEVKTRTSNKYGNPIEAVNKIKQKHIVSASKFYCYIHDLLDYNINIRFDIIEIYKKEKFYIKHTKNCELY